MSPQLSVLAKPEDASLAGLPDANGGQPVLALGAAGGKSIADIRWLDRPPCGDDPAAERWIAPAGDGLWRAAPWPAADGLFELDCPVHRRALVAGPDAVTREAVAERAAARGVAVDSVDPLDADNLAQAACVVLADAPGGALPARAFAVLAAGRLLIVPQLTITFGLEDGLDHVQFAEPDDAVTLIEAYRRVPEAFGRITAWARVKAEAQRASVVYRRLAEDLRLQGRWA